MTAGCWLLAAGCWLLAAGCCSKWSSFRFPFNSNQFPMGFPLHFLSISLSRVRTSRRSTDIPLQNTSTRTTQLHKDNANIWFKNNAAEGRVITYSTSIACSCAVLVKYLITRPSAALFLKSLLMLSWRSCIVLVKVCYACKVFDNAAFGRVIFKSFFLKALCTCIVLVKVCYACEVLIPVGISENLRKIYGIKEKSKVIPLCFKENLTTNLRKSPCESKRN